MPFDVYAIRKEFPALNQESKPIFLDGPGGTQVPQQVLDAMVGYLGLSNSNLGLSPFFAVQRTREIVAGARERAAAFVNAPSPSNIVLGANSTTLVAHMARSISREWKQGDEIIVTALDHFSNVSFWRQYAEDRGVTCHVARIHPEDCTLDYEYLEKIISLKTKLVAFSMASNVAGSHSDAARIIKVANAVGALTYVDAVHYAPHYLPDVQALGCDFLACSGYKFFGPHMGFVYGKAEHLTRLKPYKVEPAPTTPPDCWETGTKSFEALAGFNAAIDYLARGQGASLREKLQGFYKDVMTYEQEWAKAFLQKASGLNSMKIYGITDPQKTSKRTSTFAFTFEGCTPLEVSDHLAHRNIATGAGNFYGVGVTDALGLTSKGGIVRAGAVHYNTLEELDTLFNALEDLP